MKIRLSIFAFIAFLFLATSCSHLVVRTGYEKQRAAVADCTVNITKDQSVLEYSSQLGKIKLGETGFSIFCSEEKALEILKREACAIEANTVLIVSERSPDWNSTCYRCEAIFLQMNSTSIKENFEHAKPNTEQLQQEKKSENKKDARVVGAILGAAIGFAIGFLLMTAALGG